MHLSWCDLFTDIVTTWASYSPSLISAHWDTWLWEGGCACTGQSIQSCPRLGDLFAKWFLFAHGVQRFPFFLAPMKQLSFYRGSLRTFSLHQRRGNCIFRFGIQKKTIQSLHVKIKMCMQQVTLGFFTTTKTIFLETVLKEACKEYPLLALLHIQGFEKHPTNLP